MAYLAAPRTGAGTTEPLYFAAQLDYANILKEGALDERHWISFLDSANIIEASAVHGHPI